MNVLSISTDRNIFTDGSAVSARAAAYAEHFDSYEVVVFAKHGHVPNQFAPRGSAYPTNSSSRILYPFGAFWLALKHQKPDVITTQDPFETGLVGFVLSWWLKVPLHVQLHTNPFAPGYRSLSLLNFFRRILCLFVLTRATRIRVVLEATRDVLQQKGIKAPITVLPIFVDQEKYQALVRTKHSRFKIALLCIGRLEREKNFGLAIRALAEVRKAGHDAGLTIVGSGREDASLKAFAASMHMTQYVDFVGWQEDTCPYLSSADILLVTSRYEGYGMVIVEALAAGVPVLSTDVGCAREAGAIVVSPKEFSKSLLKWITSGPRTGDLAFEQPTTFDEYVEKLTADIRACANVR